MLNAAQVTTDLSGRSNPHEHGASGGCLEPHRREVLPEQPRSRRTDVQAARREREGRSREAARPGAEIAGVVALGESPHRRATGGEHDEPEQAHEAADNQEEDPLCAEPRGVAARRGGLGCGGAHLLTSF